MPITRRSGYSCRVSMLLTICIIKPLGFSPGCRLLVPSRSYGRLGSPDGLDAVGEVGRLVCIGRLELICCDLSGVLESFEGLICVGRLPRHAGGEDAVVMA